MRKIYTDNRTYNRWLSIGHVSGSFMIWPVNISFRFSPFLYWYYWKYEINKTKFILALGPLYFSIYIKM